MSKPTPPQAARRFLSWFCRDELLEEVAGDLHEAFEQAATNDSARRARLNYWKEVILFVRLHTLRRERRPGLSQGPIMWRNYLQVALRTMKKNAAYSALNLFGLALGLAATFLISVFVFDELSFDNYHESTDQIYRLVTAYEDSDFEGIAKVNGPWGLAAKEEIPAIEAVTRFVFFGSSVFEYEGLRGQDGGGFYADSTVFDVFSWGLTRGDPSTALIEPYSLVVTESFALQYFGRADPYGESIRVAGTTDYRVTGVMPDVPSNSHFTFTFLASMSGYEHESHDDWVAWNQYYTYLTLRDRADPDAVAEAATAILPRNMEAESARAASPLALQPLGDIYLRSNMFREISAMGDMDAVAIFALLAFLILLIAAVNFVNLATARSTMRAREVGVRKSLGARRWSVIKQFLGESILTVALASLLAVGLILFALPTFNSMAGKAFVFADLTQPKMLLGAALGIVALGLTAGLYPALVLSSFRPAHVMRGPGGAKGGIGLRRGLVVVQFIISGGLIIGTGIVSDQLEYLEDRPLGFDREALASFSIEDNSLVPRHDDLKAAIAAIPGVEGVALSGNRPGGGDWGIPIQIPGLTAEEVPPVRMLVGDHDYVRTYGMNVIEGRGFDVNRSTDATEGLLINQEMAKQLGWTNPVGQQVLMPAVDRSFVVIGVLEDFHFRSVHEAIGPLMLFNAPDNWFSMVNVRFGGGDVQPALEAMSDVYGRFDSTNPIAISFIDERFDSLYAADRRLADLLWIATLLAIAVACLGLFGLAAYTAERRTKEIGVRKVVGASESRIIFLLTRESAVLVTIALVVAIPIAVISANSWLGEFAYHATVSPITVALGAMLAAGLAVATTGFQAWKAARLNPARSLRTE